jgi:hypothetical protein
MPPGRRGQSRIYCSAECRKAAELDRRAERKVAAFRAAIGDVASRENLMRWLSAGARNGSVAAMRLLLEEFRRDPDPDQESSIIDELARRRKGRGE